ncbi:hypothetical protein Ssi02_74150 [Sinosporangium siamense]|uniref:Uncharacterized protein n=1 Tax=Sinosporangium siamense TaxID=1367973 RepID=A0A919RR41_9ACTN|nr:hypothetical protein Ssi02_74150 [Sinosporangium siamense]
MWVTQTVAAPRRSSGRFRPAVPVGPQADRSMLIVLDNAATISQVRLLLPGNSGCLAVVTSRDDSSSSKPVVTLIARAKTLANS